MQRMRLHEKDDNLVGQIVDKSHHWLVLVVDAHVVHADVVKRLKSVPVNEELRRK
jgi:phosphoribosyl-ATP pyrophosphohydrolase